jgi:predicted Zn-dependent peptidase
LNYSKKIIDQQHERTILENGVTILSMSRDDVDSISIEIWIKVGSRYESISLNGLAHFIEHMNFKGTKTRSAQQIAEEIDAIGGYLNAYTSRENTVYSAKVLKEYLPLAIDILSDIIFNSIYDEDEIEREKNVVLQELAQTEDSPEEMVMEYFSETSFLNQALGRSILGTKDNISSFNRTKIIDFIQEYYTAPRIIISAVGNLAHKELVELVNKHLNPFVTKECKKAETAYYTGGIKLEHDTKLSQLQLVIGYEGVNINSKQYYTQEILAGILGGSLSSRLFQEIREKRGLVYSVGSFCQYYPETGIFGICLSSSSDKLLELLDILSTELNKVTHNINENEINRCLAQVRASLFMSRESIDNLASILANNYSCYGRYISRNEIWENYNLVTLNDLHNLAKKTFSRENKITISSLGDINSMPKEAKLIELLSVK